MTSPRLIVVGIVLSTTGCGDPEVPVVDASVVATDAGTDASSVVVDDTGPGTDAPVLVSDDTGTPAVDARVTMGSYAVAPVALGELEGIPETSGIVASRDYANVFWIHNDSGNPEEIYAIDREARVVATITITGATNQDWEDIAIVPVDGTDFLYIGDHGDNEARTSDGASSSRDGYVRLYRIEEPDPTEGDATVAATEIRLVYPDGPHDCEGMFVDPNSADVYLFSKVDSGSADLYRGSALAIPGPNTLVHVASYDMLSITAADMSSDGARLAIRNYAQIRVFDVESGDLAAALTTMPLRPSTRGSAAEAIAFGPSSYDLYTIAEGEPSTLFEIAWE